MKNIKIIFVFIFISLLFPIEKTFASKSIGDYTTAEYILVCGEVELESGETEWTCQIVPVTVGLSATIAGTGGGGTTTKLYLVCWEHYENGRPTGETIAVSVSLK